ncbi:Nn.00g020140.m01.CDS01 [Neocucurbitaria sp. VM-36]
MAPPTNTPEDNAAFLYACVQKSKSLRDVYETLGLYCETTTLRKEPDFHNAKAKALHAEIKEIAQSFEGRYRNNLEHLKEDLSNEITFSTEIRDLQRKYGQAIWGRADPEHTRSFGEQGGALEELNWDNISHRETIRFYIHCWIVTVVMRDISSTPRKGKGKGKSKTIYVSDGEQVDVESPVRSSRSDSSGPSQIPYCAPEPPNMISTFENRGPNARPAVLRSCGEGLRPNASIEGSVGISPEMGTGLPLKHTHLSSPTKRKAPDAQDPYSVGKLPKLSREAGTISIPSQVVQRDVYSVPRSPTIPLVQAPLGSLTGRQRWKGSSQNTDATYMPPPRGFTAETETVVDEDETAADAIDLVIKCPFANEEGMQYGYQDQPTAGPSGTYRNPLRQDSVIPDTQNDTGASLELTESRLTTSSAMIISDCNDAVPTPPSLRKWQEKQDRRELFKLLLSYLNSINQFSPDSYDGNTEERMDSLLNRLWAHDEGQLRSELGNDFARLQTVLTSWMNMRDRLTKFQTTTGYLGQPGEPWRAHLRRMLEPARAQACIAFCELQDLASEEAELQYVAGSFDDDLATIFHLITRVNGCNGAEEFKAVRVFNEALLVWMRDD